MKHIFDLVCVIHWGLEIYDFGNSNGAIRRLLFDTFPLSEYLAEITKFEAVEKFSF